ncbi:acetylglutamate kinase [Streptomyces chumphonensis]|uniref:Acetylglutamate kinase n=1 Tax=Streptomyces chumphonensis TaxID=1214925 RepID=A0A927EW27_9ACTN|nr:acetylglutamate kinase [Streptomyces chumphonensis]MBD3931119.1 acetylglutamate kinase [Streptomyces chumphonensis]
MSDTSTAAVPAAGPARPPAREPARRRDVGGRIAVIKVGGGAMTDEAVRRGLARDVVESARAGLRPVVVHGGGPQINALLTRLGLEVRFVAGLRVTTPEILDVARMVLAGRLQRDLVGDLNRHGPWAVGMTGEDAHTMTAVPRETVIDGKPVDLGLVGEVVAVRTGAVRALLDQGRVPVVSPLARGADGRVYNVNADLAASALASALGADRLVMLTDVEGLYARWPHSSEVVPSLTARELEQLLPALSSGMRPKMEGCLRAVRGGVRTAHVLDGRAPHAVLKAVFGTGGSWPGTVVTADQGG